MMAPPKPTGEKPQKEPTGGKPQKEDVQLQKCVDPACNISFAPWCNHTRCFRHSKCFVVSGRYNPLQCELCYTILEALEDPNNDKKWEMAQPLIAWTRQGTKRYHRMCKKAGKEPTSMYLSSMYQRHSGH